MKENVIDITDLHQDVHNFNKGTEQGQQLMERSFKELGAGRSILLDKNGNIIAGNKSQQAAIAAGIKKVRVIETNGDELVAVKRMDVDIDSAEGRRMAYLDNLTTQVNLEWDQTELEAVQADVDGFDIADFGFDIGDAAPELDLDGLRENGFIEHVKDNKGVFQVTFIFPKEHEDTFKAYVNKYGKEQLEQKIIELCQNVEAK